MSSNLLKKTYTEVSYVSGPLLYLQNAPDLSYNAIVRIVDGTGRERGGQVIEVSKEFTVLQVFEETSGIDLSSTTVNLVEDVARLGVSKEMIGRRFNDIAPVSTIARIPCPVLLVHGQQDDLVPLECAQRLKEAAPRATLLAVQGRHDRFDNEEGLNEQVRVWLEAHTLLPA
jgi:pimeloyl-ACP methyl ester carboxylesterase